MRGLHGLWLVVMLAGPLRAESGLIEFTLGLPERDLSQAQSDLTFDLARRLEHEARAVFDPPSRGALGHAQQRLSAVIDKADAEAAAVMGPSSRGMAEFLARTLLYRQMAQGWDAMWQDAARAVAIERQLSANAVLLAEFFPGTIEAPVQGVRTRAAEDVLTYLDFEAEIERGRGAPSPTRSEAAAFWFAQAAFTGETAMATLAPRRREAVAFVEAAEISRVQDLRRLVAQLNHLNMLIAQGFAFPDPERTEASIWAGIEKAQAEMQALIAERADVADALFPWLRTVGDAQRALRPDEALVLIAPAGAHVLLFALTQDGFVMRRAGADPVQLMDQAQRLRQSVGWASDRSAIPIAGAAARPKRDAALRDEAYMAYQALLEPLDPLIRDRGRLLVVATVQVGLNLPFEMFLTSPAPAGAANAELDWLVKRQAVTQVPSVDLLWQRDFPGRLPETEIWYAGFGGPDYALPSTLGRSNWATRLLAQLRPLPDAAEEVRQVAAAFGEGKGMAVTGADASEYLIEELSEAGTLGKFSVLHFATHGLVHGDHPDVGEPLLALTPLLDLAQPARFELGTIDLPRPDGALEAGEIRQLKLRARLVILSACSTGVIDGDQDALQGLGTSFLAAGAERVLGTHWPINSAAAVEIVTGMSRRDPQFADPARALQQTLVEIIAQGGAKADPAYWSAFSLMGSP